MKNSAKIGLTSALFSNLGAGTLIKAVHATQTQNLVEAVKPASIHAIAPNNPLAQVAEAPEGDGDGETNDDAKEKQESARLQSLSKITPEQAQQSAEKAVGGKASRIKLENEDGDLIYSVLIGENDVKVDAGNAQVLYIENTKNHLSKVNEKSRPHSSIRLSEGAGGDGDGETNDDG